MELLPRDGRKSHTTNRIVHTLKEGTPTAHKLAIEHGSHRFN